MYFLAKELGMFVSMGKGIFRVRTDADVSDSELVDAALEGGDEEAGDFDGWIYAFSFPSIVSRMARSRSRSVARSEMWSRVSDQFKGSAAFEPPVILFRRQVKHVGLTELAIHGVLQARDKWREFVPCKGSDLTRRLARARRIHVYNEAGQVLGECDYSRKNSLVAFSSSVDGRLVANKGPRSRPFDSSA